jgi:methylmalonyl-CoA carboxyltransferase 5S subunit
MGPYNVLTGEFADLMLGYYGQTAASKDLEVLKKAEAHGKKPPITCRPADLLPPEWDELKKTASAIPGFNGSDEDVLTAAMFPQVAQKFFPSRKDGPKNLGKDPAKAKAPVPAQPTDSAIGAPPLHGPVTYSVSINGRTHKVTVGPS